MADSADGSLHRAGEGPSPLEGKGPLHLATGATDIREHHALETLWIRDLGQGSDLQQSFGSPGPDLQDSRDPDNGTEIFAERVLFLH